VPAWKQEEMAYTNINFKTKKELIEAVKNGEDVFLVSQGFFPAPQNGRVTIEGPQYPQPHKWYASATIEDGKVVTAK
jgi:hypothetical protein